MPRKNSSVMKVLPPRREPKTRVQSLEEKLKIAKKDHAKATKAWRAAELKLGKTLMNVKSLEEKLRKKNG